MTEDNHKAGFVSLIGKPNAGKSTLMNVLVGERLSIITSKAQTTRHRILGIINSDEFQIAYSDTPGIIKPVYKLQEAMMDFVRHTLKDSDVILFITDLKEKFDEEDALTIIRKSNVPVIVIINKIDLAKDQEEVEAKVEEWNKRLKPAAVIPLSALEKFNTEGVLPAILEHLPNHPAFFDKDTLTDKPQRFFAAELIRECIFNEYQKEVPYSTEVVISDFIDEPNIIRIRAEIIVERDSQKGILIGKGGSALKRIGTNSRKMMETFFDKKVFLEQYVKVEQDWRKKENQLKRFGYTN